MLDYPIFNPDDANGDLDHDGLTNIFEYDSRLNMGDDDTDHDGINDGNELNYCRRCVVYGYGRDREAEKKISIKDHACFKKVVTQRVTIHENKKSNLLFDSLCYTFFLLF